MTEGLRQADAGRMLRQAVAHHQAGQLQEAARLYQGVLQHRPDQAEANHNLGVLLLQTGQFAVSLPYFKAALTADAQEPQYWLSYADALIQSGERASARQVLGEGRQRGLAGAEVEALLARLGPEPGMAMVQSMPPAAAHDELAVALNQGRFADAEVIARRLTTSHADYGLGWKALGISLFQQRRLEEAIEPTRQAMRLLPLDAEVGNNLGIIYKDLERFDEAERELRRALEVDPGFAQLHYNLGNVLSDLDRHAEAEASLRRAIQLMPAFAAAHDSLGQVLTDMGRVAEAQASLRRARELKPDFANARVNDAHCRLLAGDYERGWRQFEWRWRAEPLASAARTFAQPLWLGESALAGTTILLHAEQGLGDTLQFCRYVPMAVAAGARVILEVPPPLTAMLASLDARITTIAIGEPLPDFDCHCPLMSLPLAFKTALQTIPADVPYVFADPTKVAAWRTTLGPASRLRVGLVWSGNPRQFVDRVRSLRFDQLAPLLAIDDVEFHSLQLGDEAVAQWREHPLRERVVDHSGELDDFADTAALVEHLDLMISVDTSVVHLAGALGKPFWLLNRFNTCWRWLLERDDSPWYPTARIFRQPSFGDWDSVIATVATELTAFIGEHRRTPAPE